MDMVTIRLTSEHVWTTRPGRVCDGPGAGPGRVRDGPGAGPGRVCDGPGEGPGRVRDGPGAGHVEACLRPYRTSKMIRGCI